MLQPKITIITVVYNGAVTIEQTISSVVNQIYPNIEFIIVDGGSTDGTVEIIQRYSKKISKWISEPDNGIYDAMNKGVALATGEYVEIIGADDCLCSYDVMVRVAEQLNENVDILSCYQYGVDEKLGLETLIKNDLARDKKTYHGGMIPHGSMFVKRSLFDRYPFDTEYKVVSDYKFFLQCYYDQDINFKYVDLPVVYFSMAGVSNTLDLSGELSSLYEELGLDFSANRTGIIYEMKKKIKLILEFTGLYQYKVCMYRKYSELKKRVTWEKHHCKNKVCRWCGRNVNEMRKGKNNSFNMK